MGVDASVWNKEKFISVLKRFRREKDLTQSQLGEYLNVSLSTIRRWESAKDDTMPAMCDVPAIACKLGITIDELITGIPTKAVNIQRATGLSAKAIETLQQIRRSPSLLVVNKMLEEKQFIASTFQLQEIINMKKELYAGEMCQDYERTRNAIRGAQFEMMEQYGGLVRAVTDALAKKALTAEAQEVLEEWQQRGYEPISVEEVEAMFNEQWGE